MAKVSYDKLKEIVREEVKAVIKEAFGMGVSKANDAKDWGSSEGVNSFKNGNWTKGNPKASKKDVTNPIPKADPLDNDSVVPDKPKEKIKFAVSKKKREIQDPGFGKKK